MNYLKYSLKFQIFLSIQVSKYISQSKVIPVYKNEGSGLDVSNYRPIANIDKIFEKTSASKTHDIKSHTKIIKYSTLHNRVTLTEEICECLDKGSMTCSVFLDLQKAFHIVVHDILLEKLNHCGISGKCKDWVKSYLKDQKQFVTVNNVVSETKFIEYGVPQGLVLGPLSFKFTLMISIMP